MSDSSDNSKWIRCIVLATKKEGMSQEEFDEYWTNIHGKIAAHYPNVVRYSQLHIKGKGTVQDLPDNHDLPVHGIVDFIYTSAEDIPHIWESPAGSEGVDDSPNFLTGVTEFYVEEQNVTDHLGLGALTDRELVSEPLRFP